MKLSTAFNLLFFISLIIQNLDDAYRTSRVLCVVQDDELHNVSMIITKII